MDRISPDQLRDLYALPGEFALIDPREEMLFARGHLFAATNMPLSRIELLVDSGIPLKNTLIVLCDDGEGSAEQAGEVLRNLDYTNLAVLDGGVPAWALSGGAVFAGVNVPSKAFGEAVEHELQTPNITSAELHARFENEDDILLLDSRPMSEHAAYCIPGSICCPSAEMVLRAPEIDGNREKEVVVHCAGRTRAIIGAQTLIDSGLFDNVRALRNGTPGWEFEGFTMEHGNTREIPLPDGPGSDALSIAERMRNKWSIPALRYENLRRWQQQTGTRYVFDVRSEAEYIAGHIVGAKHIPGGQLIQTTEAHIPVQNAHVVLVDDDGIRSVTSAVWLRRMGWKNVSTHTMTAECPDIETGVFLQFQPSADDWIKLTAAEKLYREEQAVFCDIRRSYSYRRGHVPGSAFLTRHELNRSVSKLPHDRLIVLIANDEAYAALVIQDLTALGRTAKVMEGGMDAWIAEGLPLQMGEEWWVSRPIDVYLDPEHFEGKESRIRENHAYLSWEIALIEHIKGDPAVRFDFSFDKNI